MSHQKTSFPTIWKPGKFLIVALIFLLLVSGCMQKPSAEDIIIESIQMHGVKDLFDKNISFNFRGRDYSGRFEEHSFTFQRLSGDSLTDIYSSDGFTRILYGDTVSVPEEAEKRFSNSINSVLYFALLPYKLDDPAVNAEYTGKTKIDGQNYFEVKITFSQSGGGEDYEDIFCYWFHDDTFRMDYLAYLFHTNQGGTRFRKAVNQRMVNGILFSDYENFKGPFPFEVCDLDSLYQEGALEKVSEINLTNIQVQDLMLK